MISTYNNNNREYYNYICKKYLTNFSNIYEKNRGDIA